MLELQASLMRSTKGRVREAWDGYRLVAGEAVGLALL